MARHIVAPFFPRLITLPVGAALDIKSGQPLAAVGPGINAYRMPEIGRNSTLLGRVTTHHRLSAAMRRHFPELLPEQHEGILVLECEMRSRIRMDEKMPLRFMERKTPLDKLPMLDGNRLKTVAPVGRNGGATPLPRPSNVPGQLLSPLPQAS